MNVVVLMLRGVNLGAHNRMKMDLLKTLCEASGLCDVQTFIQSGNVVCRTKERDLKKLAATVQQAILKKFKITSPVIVRTAAEMRDVVARNPFAARAGIDPKKLLVWFLASDPGAAARANAHKVPAAPEELIAIGSEVYVYYTNGMARPKIKFAAVEKALAVPGTGRNWNTVTKLLEMAEAIES